MGTVVVEQRNNTEAPEVAARAVELNAPMQSPGDVISDPAINVPEVDTGEQMVPYKGEYYPISKLREVCPYLAKLGDVAFKLVVDAQIKAESKKMEEEKAIEAPPEKAQTENAKHASQAERKDQKDTSPQREKDLEDQASVAEKQLPPVTEAIAAQERLTLPEKITKAELEPEDPRPQAATQSTDTIRTKVEVSQAKLTPKRVIVDQMQAVAHVERDKDLARHTAKEMASKAEKAQLQPEKQVIVKQESVPARHEPRQKVAYHEVIAQVEAARQREASTHLSNTSNEADQSSVDSEAEGAISKTDHSQEFTIDPALVYEIRENADVSSTTHIDHDASLGTITEQIDTNPERDIPAEAEFMDLPDVLKILDQINDNLELPVEFPELAEQSLADNPVGGDESFDWQSLLVSDYELFQVASPGSETFDQITPILDEAQSISAAPVVESSVIPETASPEVVKIFEQIQEKAKAMDLEVLGVVNKPLEQALQRIAEIRPDEDSPAEVYEAAEEQLIEKLEEWFEETGLLVGKEEVKSFIKYLTQQDTLEYVLASSDIGFSELFGDLGTREGWQFGLRAVQDQQPPKHSLFGKILLLLYGTKLPTEQTIPQAA